MNPEYSREGPAMHLEKMGQESGACSALVRRRQTVSGPSLML
jgi:hypothetical protein